MAPSSRMTIRSRTSVRELNGAPHSGAPFVVPTSSAIIGITRTTSCVSDVAIRAKSWTPLPPDNTYPDPATASASTVNVAAKVCVQRDRIAIVSS